MKGVKKYFLSNLLLRKEGIFMKTCLIVSTAIVLIMSGCHSSTSKDLNLIPVVYVDGLEADGIVLNQDHCTPEYVKSLLGTPIRTDSDGRLLRYTDHGFDLWFSRNDVLSEIRLNKGFEGELNTGISLSSSKQNVFKVYGKPIDEIDALAGIVGNPLHLTFALLCSITACNLRIAASTVSWQSIG